MVRPCRHPTAKGIGSGSRRQLAIEIIAHLSLPMASGHSPERVPFLCPPFHILGERWERGP